MASRMGGRLRPVALMGPRSPVRGHILCSCAPSTFKVARCARIDLLGVLHYRHPVSRGTRLNSCPPFFSNEMFLRHNISRTPGCGSGGPGCYSVDICRRISSVSLSRLRRSASRSDEPSRAGSYTSRHPVQTSTSCAPLAGGERSNTLSCASDSS